MMRAFAQQVSALLEGKIPPPNDPAQIPDEEARLLAQKLNALFASMAEIQSFIVPLSRGLLHEAKIQPGNFLASPFKALHASLLHLSWQAGEVARGDYRQRVDFMGDFSEAFNSMVAALEKNETDLKKKITELEGALSHIKTLEGLLPICSHCKKIRTAGADPQDVSGWLPLESYISEKTDARFSHSLCPDCLKKLYPDL